MDAEMMENIRANARYYRLVKGFSGPYIGEAVGRDATWVQRFEAGAIQKPTENHYTKVLNRNGNFSLKTWWKIADALCMDLRELIRKDE